MTALYIKKKNFAAVSSLLIVAVLFFLLNSSSQLTDPKPLSPDTKKTTSSPRKGKSPEFIKDGNQQDSFELGSINIQPFMPQMGNETLKAELGRSTWRLFHTILARYPDEPSRIERETLSQFLKLFVKVYPCGDCARHFAKLLEKYPPQLNNRQIAAMWGCHIHNKVNERLGKPEYDCTTILEDYDCGCGADEAEEAAAASSVAASFSSEGNAVDQEHLAYELNKEGKQLG